MGNLAPLRLALVSSTFPFGGGGSFFGAELRALLADGHEIVLLPVRPRGSRGGDAASVAGARVVRHGLIDARLIASSMAAAGSQPGLTTRAFRLIARSRNPRIFLRNFIALPKALWLGRRLRRWRVHHVHALWASVPATVAAVAADAAGLPWSFTAHRWDIEENNLLAEKLRAASFARFISHSGAELAARISGGQPDENWWVSHLGVDMPARAVPLLELHSPPVILCPARLVPLKRHADLLMALAVLSERGLEPELWLAGSGESQDGLERLATRLGLGQRVRFLGQLGHARLLELYGTHAVDVVVLASRIEGVPVALMEAMAHAVPVIATAVGGVAELISGDAGLIVPPHDPAALAAALQELLTDRAKRLRLADNARRRIETGFDAVASSRRFVERVANCSAVHRESG